MPPIEGDFKCLQVAYLQADSCWMITKKGKTDYEIYEFAAYCVWADFVKDYTSYLNSRGSIEDFVSFREMINLNLYREALAFMMKLYETLNLQAGGEYEDKDEDFRRSPYKDKDTEDIRRYS
ncbi:hypothetical protein Tco_0543980 [Tanacetum coccineum]